MSNTGHGHDEHRRASAKLHFLKIAAMPKQDPYFATKHPFPISARATMRALPRLGKTTSAESFIGIWEIQLLRTICHLSEKFLHRLC